MKGATHEVVRLDDEWVLKTFKPASVLRKQGFYDPNITQKEALENFNEHIETMIKHPDIFPKVKRLDRYRVLVENCTGGENIDRELNSIRMACFPYKYESSPVNSLYKDPKKLKILERSDNPIHQKWYNFIIRLREAFDGLNLDLSDNNIGLDKYGNIKLLDF